MVSFAILGAVLGALMPAGAQKGDSLAAKGVGFGAYIFTINGTKPNARVTIACEASARGDVTAKTINIYKCRFTSPHGGSVNAIHVLQPGPEAWAVGTGSVTGPTRTGFTICMGATITYIDGSKITRDDCDLSYVEAGT